METFLILLAGAILGIVVEGLCKYVWKSYTQKTRHDIEIDRATRRASVTAGRKRISQEQLATKLLIEFYRVNGPRHVGLSAHVVSLSGTSKYTGVMTRKEWQSLGVRIAHDSQECSLVEDAPPCPSLTGQERQELLQAFKAEGRRIRDAPIFRLLRFNAARGKAKIELTLDTFYNYLCSNGALERELYHALIDADFSPEKVLKNSQQLLPFRHRFLPDANALLGFQSRMCAGGAHVLLAFRRPEKSGNDYVFFARRRSTEVATGESVMTLIPMGYHQPTLLSTARNEIPLAMSVYRETYEELFGGTELEEEPRYVTPGWYLRKYHPLAWFLDNPASFTIEIVSFGVSLLPGNYEIAVLLAVHDPRFWEQFNEMIQLNWEVEDTETPLISAADSRQLTWLVKENTWAGSSLFALAECLQRLAQLDETKVVRPPPMSTLLT